METRVENYKIYTATNKINNKKYIGQTIKSIKKRAMSHFCDAKNNSNFYFHNAIRKYGKDNFLFEVIEYCKNSDIANEREKYWIEYYKSNNKDFGYNTCAGGTGTTGHTLSKEARLKLSILNKGKKLSEETKKKIGLAGKGRRHTEETKRKISLLKKGIPQKGRKWTSQQREKLMKSMIGRKISAESKLKMSIAASGRKCKEETKRKISDAQKNHKVSNETREKIANSKLKNFDKNMLLSMYIKLKIIKKIAKQLNCCTATVLKYLRKYQIVK